MNLADETFRSIISNRISWGLCPSAQRKFPAALSPAPRSSLCLSQPHLSQLSSKFCVTPLWGSDHLPAIPAISATFLPASLIFLGLSSLPVVSGEGKKSHYPGVPCGEGPGSPCTAQGMYKLSQRTPDVFVLQASHLEK